MTNCMQCNAEWELEDEMFPCEDCGDEICSDCTNDGLCDMCAAIRDENNEGDA